MTYHMNHLSPPNLVALITKRIYLDNVSAQTIDSISRIGAYEDKRSSNGAWAIDFTDDDELAKRLSELRDLGFLFVGEDPSGWSPAAVFSELRERKIIQGNFVEVNWRGPGNWFVTEK